MLRSFVANVLKPIHDHVVWFSNRGRTRFFRPGRTKILFVNGCRQGPSQRYRIYNFLSPLEKLGFSCEVVLPRNLQRFVTHPDYDLLVIFRANLTPLLESAIAAARKAGIPVVFDVDDLVFEPESVHYAGWLRGKPEDQLGEHREFMRSLEATLLKCDFVTVSTEFLRQRVLSRGRPAQVIKLTPNRQQEAFARFLNRLPKRGTPVQIGYFSGTLTHNRDFEEVSSVLADVLNENPDVELHVVGELALPAALKSLRVIQKGLTHHLRMLIRLSRVDINLAPLELANPFTDSKAETKIFEAALVGVPTIASPVSSYKSTIENGKTGFLAETRTEWKAALTKLIREPNFRKGMGEAATREISPCFDLSTEARKLAQLYEQLIADRKSELGLLPIRSPRR